MFELNEKYESNKKISKCVYTRYSPSEISTINTDNFQIYVNIPREGSGISFLYSYLELNCDVLQAATNNRYVDNIDIKLVNLGSIALFNKHKLTLSSSKHLENIEHGHIACLMYKLLTTAGGCYVLSIVFHRDRDTRQQELTNNKKTKGKYHVRIYLKDKFGFAQHQLKGTYGLGHILPITRIIDCAVLNKDNAINNAKAKNNSIHWYVPQYTTSIAQQAILYKQIQSKTHAELQNSGRSILWNN